MKSLILLSCTALAVACGSSSGTAVDGMQTPPLPSGASQVPQQPSDSVAPANTQAAPLDPQQAPINPQQPGQASTGGLCAQVMAAAMAAGCDVSAADITACETAAAAGAPCGAKWQAELNCLASHPIVCNDNGELSIDATCRAEAVALGECTDAATPACTSPSCNGCSDACTTCACRQITDTGRSCTNECAVMN